MKRFGFAGVVVLLSGVVGWSQGLVGFDGGRAVAEGAAGSVVVGNRTIAARCAGEGGLRVEVRDVVGHRAVQLGSPFRVLFADGSIVRAEQMRVVERPVVEDLKVDAGASRAAERIGGKGVRAVLEDDKSGLRVEWRLE